MAVHHSGVQSSTNTLSKKGVRRLEKAAVTAAAAGGCMSEPEFYEPSHTRPSKARSEQRINGFQDQHDLVSPTSDDVDIFDSHCFATTPSSSNASDAEEAPASPTSQLLIEYEEHLRNTLEKDSESYSLHTFEALLSRSMENLGSPSFKHSGLLCWILWFSTIKSFRGHSFSDRFMRQKWSCKTTVTISIVPQWTNFWLEFLNQVELVLTSVHCVCALLTLLSFLHTQSKICITLGLILIQRRHSWKKEVEKKKSMHFFFL